jgi:hypothetical protein
MGLIVAQTYGAAEANSQINSFAEKSSDTKPTRPLGAN